MATRDIETQLYTQLMDNVFLAYADWKNAFAVGSIIRYDQVGGTQDPVKIRTSDGDYPQAELWLRNGQTDLFEGDVNFGTYSDTPPNHWLENQTYTFRLRTVSQLLNVGEPDQLGALSRAAIRTAGPRLGIADVTKVRLNWDTTRTTEDDDQQRWVTNLDINLQLQVDGSTLT